MLLLLGSINLLYTSRLVLLYCSLLSLMIFVQQTDVEVRKLVLYHIFKSIPKTEYCWLVSYNIFICFLFSFLETFSEYWYPWWYSSSPFSILKTNESKNKRAGPITQRSVDRNHFLLPMLIYLPLTDLWSNLPTAIQIYLS